MKLLHDMKVERFHGISLSEYVVAGYTYPVSVKQLHLHLVLPPFKHEKVFLYPRWHSHEKVIHELSTYGKVRTYDQFPDEEEWRRQVFDHAMKGHAKFRLMENVR